MSVRWKVSEKGRKDCWKGSKRSWKSWIQFLQGWSNTCTHLHFKALGEGCCVSVRWTPPVSPKLPNNSLIHCSMIVLQWHHVYIVESERVCVLWRLSSLNRWDRQRERKQRCTEAKAFAQSHRGSQWQSHNFSLRVYLHHIDGARHTHNTHWFPLCMPLRPKKGHVSASWCMGRVCPTWLLVLDMQQLMCTKQQPHNIFSAFSPHRAHAGGQGAFFCLHSFIPTDMVLTYPPVSHWEHNSYWVTSAWNLNFW